MESNLMGELLIINTMNIKPNFSDLERKYKINRHTIAKYYNEGGKFVKKRSKKRSKLDNLKDEIKNLFLKENVNKKAVYEYLKDKYGKDAIGSFSNFRHFTIKNNIKKNTVIKIHPRYETKPGYQLQVDWKENIKLKSKTGEIYRFNIFSATLSNSRLHIFKYSKNRTTEDFIRCLIDTFRHIGGMTQTILTDNMTSIVSIIKGHRHKYNQIKTLEKDLGININLCNVRTPETKGKDESANRFITWLNAYDGEINSEEDIIKLVENLTSKVNLEINQTTKIPPIKLFEKEKEYLCPLPNKVLLDTYISNSIIKTVPNTFLIEYKGCFYSVPKAYIGKNVELTELNNLLYIYYKGKLLCIHNLSSKRFNYKENHYKDGIASILHYKEDNEINNIVLENLQLLDRIGGKYE